MHVGLGGVDGLSVHQEYHARGVQLEPHLLDDAIEIELQSGGNLLRHDRITLLGAGGLGPLADARTFIVMSPRWKALNACPQPSTNGRHLRAPRCAQEVCAGLRIVAGQAVVPSRVNSEACRLTKS